MNTKEIIRQITELKKGIVPSCVWYDKTGGINLDRWSSISEKEIHRSKRKFRKIFRKACRKFDLSPSEIKNPKRKSWIVRKYIAEICKEDIQS